jgi:cold shock CspA family protein
MDTSASPALAIASASPIVESDVVVGNVIGQCKWFNDKLGFGFVTVQDGPEKGKDIFVHHSGIKPLNSNYKTLKKGEYINFNIVSGENGPQGVNITGILGGTLMCDVLPAVKTQPPPVDPGFTMVNYGGHNYNSPPPPPYGGGRGGGGGRGRGGGGRGGYNYSNNY